MKDCFTYLVSAIVSAYHSERFIAGRLQNLIDQPMFKRNQLEIIVIDSNSPQNEKEIVEGYIEKYENIRYVRTGMRETVYGAWNRGIKLACGKYIINANTDDRFTPDALEKMANELDHNNTIHAVYGDWLVTNTENDSFDSGSDKFIFHYPDFTPPLFFYFQITSHAALVRKEVFDMLGYYNEELRVFGDREFMFRFAVSGLKAKKIDSVIGIYLEAPNSVERSEPSAEKEFASVRGKYLMPEYFVRLFGHDHIPGKKDLAQLYAFVGSLGYRFFSHNGKPVSDLPFAAQVFKLALKLDPANVTAMNNLGVLRCVNGQHVQGLKLFHDAINIGHKNKIKSNMETAKHCSIKIEEYLWLRTEVNCPGSHKQPVSTSFEERPDKTDIENPVVSVIIPTCDRADLLVEAIESVKGQTYIDLEVIVVNDGGEDISGVVDPYKSDCSITVLNLGERKGPAMARNCGLKSARGKYIAYLDDDDVYYPNHLEAVVGFLEKSGSMVAYTDSCQALRKWDGSKYVTAEKRLVYSEDFDRQRLLVMNYIPTLNIVHRKDCIEGAGLFDEGLETHEDWDLWIRMSQKYDFHHIKAVTAEFRTRADSSISTSSKRPDFLKTMKIIHARYAYLAAGDHILRQQKYIEDELKKEIIAKGNNNLKREDLSIVTTKKGNRSLRVKTRDGSLKTLHSLYDPEAEAESMVDAFHFDGRGILVVLGLGLGYHVAELVRKYPQAEIIVIEAVPEIYEFAKEHGPGIDGEVGIITGFPPDDALRKITEHQIKKGMSPVSVFALSSAVSAFPNYYRPLLDALNKTISVKLWDRLRYEKFKPDKQKVLLIDTGYFLVREAEKALISLDHEVLRIPVDTKGNGEPIISRFVEAVVDFKPDFMLTMNHLGFDEDGVLTEFFRSIEMPVASWYVDSPRLIVQAFDKNVSPWMSLFLWDKAYMKDMEAMGFESVEYLPLGTDESLFKPLTAGKHKKKLDKYSCDIGFVGNSMVGPVKEWMEKVAPDFHPMVEKAAEYLAHSATLHGDIMKVIPETEREKIASLTKKEKMNYEAAVLWKATLLYRLSCVQMLKEFNVSIYGDSAWKGLLREQSFRLFPPLNYYKELPFLYNACRINFNATSRQMSEAVNQRVFDVPACGTFILTDYQVSLEELFDVGREVITYRQKEEIPELVRFYLNNQSTRDDIARKGRERVLKEHTYRHRLDVLVRSMKERYA
jgi:spore maturation protein CgeB